MTVMPISDTQTAGFFHSRSRIDETTSAVTNTSFRLVTDLQGIRELEQDWRNLEGCMAGHPNPFLGFNWNLHWCEHFLSSEDGRANPTPCILVGKVADQVNMIWPLVLEQNFGMRTLKFMGAPVSQYGDILVEDTPDLATRLKSAWDYLCDELKPDAFHARKVRADSAIAALLQSQNAIAIEQTAAPYADLHELSGIQEYQTRFSKKFRRNCRRQANRLHELGDVTFSVVEESDLASELTGQAIDMKMKWLREQGHIYSAFDDSRVKSFFQSVAADTERPSGVLVSVMSVNGRPAAMEIGISTHGHYAAHIGTFDSSYASLSVGTIQMTRTIEHLIEKGVSSYDLMAPASDYKRKWADASTGVADFVTPISTRGRMFGAIYLKRLRPLLKTGIINVLSALKTMKLL